MGISRDQAYNILGLDEGAPDFLVRAHYCRLANKYHPDRNPHNREIALQKFQRIVNAYVRLQIEPDDCDQLKMKMILTELYAINEDILSGEYSSSGHIDEPDISVPCTDLVLASSSSSSSSSSSERGPYADVLQDFMIRSYMSGGRKTKPTVNMTVDKKLEASEKAMELASKHADELLKDEEEERKKEEKRKLKNKKKKEAKRRKRVQTSSGKKKPSQFIVDDSVDYEDDDEDEEEMESNEDDKDDSGIVDGIISNIGDEELDLSGAFFSKVNITINDQPIAASTGLNGGKISRGDSTSSTASKSSVSSKTSSTSSATENTWPAPKKSSSGSSIESGKSSTGCTGTSFKSAATDTKKVDSKKFTAAAAGKGSDGGGIAMTTRKTIEKPLREINNDDSRVTGRDKGFKTYPSATKEGRSQKTFFKGGSGGGGGVLYNATPSSFGKYYQSDLPPRFAKLAQSKSGRNNYYVAKRGGDGERDGGGGDKNTYIDAYACDNTGTQTESDEGETNEGIMLSISTTSTSKETEIVENPKTTGGDERYSPEAVFKNGNNELDQSRRMAVLGNKAAKEGQFYDAVMYFSKAIEHYAFDLRYYGNRSFCYEHLKEYSLALQDANEALRINEDWPKGHFRKGKALVGLKKYEEAEECFRTAIDHDPDYIDAVEELRATQIKRLTDMGFSEERSSVALDEYESFDQALEALIPNDGQGEVSRHTEEDPGSAAYNQAKGATQSLGNRLWVGNVDPAVITEGMLFDAFKRCGKIEGVRILPGKFCAFVEFSSPDETALALDIMQDYCLEDCTLFLKIPDNPSYVQSGKKNAKSSVSRFKSEEECYYWRTTGCLFGAKCRKTHILKNKGIDADKIKYKGSSPVMQRFRKK